MFRLQSFAEWYIIILMTLRREVNNMDYISIAGTAERRGITRRSIQMFCIQECISKSTEFRNTWTFSKDTERTQIDVKAKN